MKKYVLITGASTGIGYELAKLYAADKHNLILVARSEERLKLVAKEFNNIDVKIIALDLAKEDSYNKLINYIEINKLDVYVVVNNAGIGSFGEYKDISLDEDEKLIDLNIKALTKITKYFLIKFTEKRNGRILNVASTAAFAAGPKMALYYASKAYVLNFTEAIHEEGREYGVKVSCLCPGPVKTAFQEKSGIKKSKKAKKYLMEADDVARIAYKEFNKGKVIIIPGIKNKFLVIANKFLPRKISRLIILKANRG